MNDNLIAAAILIGFYPFVVLCVALTGPHSDAERRDKERRR